MCRPDFEPAKSIDSFQGTKRLRIWPVNPLVVIALIPLLPTWLYLNRGYTVWFHLVTIAYVLTQSEFLRRFLIVMGSSICSGWYAAIINDLYHHERFFHILYYNMPNALKDEMVNGDGQVVYSARSLLVMFMSHILDTLLHPGIVYIMWKIHQSRGGTINSIFTWKIISCHYLLSRVWSMVHTYHNTGEVAGFYVGHDVYILHDLKSWFPAYAAEGAFTLAVVAWKIGWERRGLKSTL